MLCSLPSVSLGVREAVEFVLRSKLAAAAAAVATAFDVIEGEGARPTVDDLTSAGVVTAPGESSMTAEGPGKDDSTLTLTGAVSVFFPMPLNFGSEGRGLGVLIVTPLASKLFTTVFLAFGLVTFFATTVLAVVAATIDLLPVEAGTPLFLPEATDFFLSFSFEDPEAALEAIATPAGPEEPTSSAFVGGSKWAKSLKLVEGRRAPRPSRFKPKSSEFLRLVPEPDLVFAELLRDKLAGVMAAFEAIRQGEA
mmetsp:Transcript_21072/g.32160  ORF Transcript_21072/g.32160 Transcript_21072/m.32160 type:complete len:252 (-) Transcript_21072:351-1106(-)